MKTITAVPRPASSGISAPSRACARARPVGGVRTRKPFVAAFATLAAAFVATAILLLAPPPARAQSLVLRDVDISGYPTIRAVFHAIDRDGKAITGLSPADFTVIENGVPQPVTEVSDCSQKPITALTVDIMVDSHYHIDLAQAAVKRLAEFLQMPPSEIGITTMDEGVYIVQDLTKNRQRVLDKAAGLLPAPGTDLQRMFYDPYAGGVPFVSGRPNRKYLILVSDLHCPKFNLDTARLFADAARENIAVYSVLLNASDYNGLFATIAKRTGGRVFEQVKSAGQIDNIFTDIGADQYGAPCRIAWQSALSCDLRHTATLTLPAYGASATVTYETPQSIVPHLELSSTGFSFKDVPAGTTKEVPLTITARKGDLIVRNISMDAASFVVVDYGGTTPPFTMKENESRTLRIRYEADDSGSSFGTLRIETNICTAFAYMVGRPADGGGILPTLELIKPNGGEEFLAGSDTVITWKGVLPADTVRLEYSIDAGSTWATITNQATDLSYLWHVPNTPSRTCLARVTQLDLAANPVTIANAGIVGPYMAWTPGGQVIISGSGDTSAFVVDAATGAVRAALRATSGGAAIVMAVNPDGTLVAVGLTSGKIQIWNRITGATILTLSQNEPDPLFNTHVPRDLEWSSDGTMLASASYDTHVRVWQIPSGTRIEKFDIAGGADGVAWNRPGNWFATIERDGVKVWTLGPATNISTIVGVFRRVEWSPVGDRIATFLDYSPGDYSVRIWDAATAATVVQLIGHTNFLADMDWKPDGARIATAAYDRTVRVWDAAGGSEIYRITDPSARQPTLVRWSPDGNHLACAWTTYDSTSAVVYDGTDGAPLARYTYLGGCAGLVWSPDGTQIAINDSIAAKIWRPFPKVLQQDVSDALWAIVAPQPALGTIDIDMGTMQLGRDHDSLVTGVLCNRGGVPLHVLGMDVTGGDIGDFMIPSGAGDFTLAPGECRDITFEFMPSKTGAREAFATLRMQVDTLRDTVRIHGIGVEPDLLVEAEDIDFGSIAVGDSKDLTVDVVLKNIGAAPVTITGTSQGGPDMTQFAILSGAGAFTLAPGESHGMGLRFIAQFAGRASGRIVFERADGPEETARLHGRGLAGVAYIADAQAAPGQHLPIALMFDAQGSPRIAHPRRFRASVGMDQTLLAPSDPAAPGTLYGGTRTVTVEGAWSGTGDTLAGIPVVALLGAAEQSALELLAFDWIDDAAQPLGIETETQSGKFTLLGICREGSTRLYDEHGVATALKVAPNPASGVATVEYDLAEDGAISIELYNVAGARVMNIATGSYPAGVYSMPLATDALPTGLYLVVLRTPTAITSGRLQVSH